MNVSFETSLFWVQAHGLPLPYLSDAYAEKVAMRAGIFKGLQNKPHNKRPSLKFLHFRVDLFIEKPLPAGFFLPTSKESMLWIQFKIEKLPAFCYGCGRVGHEQKCCTGNKELVFLVSSKPISKYGVWLKTKSEVDSCFTALSRPPTVDNSETTQKLQQLNIATDVTRPPADDTPSN